MDARQLNTTWDEVRTAAVPQYALRAYWTGVIYRADGEVVIAGYASPQVIDREKHLITKEALSRDLPRFLAHPHYRNANLLHCVPPETKVKLAGQHAGEFTRIEQVKVGDRVLTHRGRLRLVKHTVKRPSPGEAIELKLANGETVRLTAEHRVLVVEHGWARAEDLRAGMLLHHMVKRGHRSWKLADPHVWKNWVVKGDNRHVSEKTRAVARHNMREIGRSGAGARATALQRLGKTLTEAYGEEKATAWMAAIADSQRGERSHFWRDDARRRGYPHSFNSLLKEAIRERDSRACVWCGRTEAEELRRYGRRLSVDHENWDKDDCRPENLRSLCVTCHGKRNGETRAVLANGVEVLSVELIPLGGWVYNLEVEEDESYVGKGIIFHNSNVQVGEVLPFWEHPETGERWETKVDDVGLFTVIKVRTDEHRPQIVDRVLKDIDEGRIASFSISADAPFDSRRYECSDGVNGKTCFWVIDSVELYEITLCETPVNQDARFTVISKSLDKDELYESAFCADGSCPLDLAELELHGGETHEGTGSDQSVHGEGGAPKPKLGEYYTWDGPGSLRGSRIQVTRVYDDGSVEVRAGADVGPVLADDLKYLLPVEGAAPADPRPDTSSDSTGVLSSAGAKRAAKSLGGQVESIPTPGDSLHFITPDGGVLAAPEQFFDHISFYEAMGFEASPLEFFGEGYIRSRSDGKSLSLMGSPAAVDRYVKRNEDDLRLFGFTEVYIDYVSPDMDEDALDELFAGAEHGHGKRLALSAADPGKPAEQVIKPRTAKDPRRPQQADVGARAGSSRSGTGGQRVAKHEDRQGSTAHHHSATGRHGPPYSGATSDVDDWVKQRDTEQLGNLAIDESEPWSVRQAAYDELDRRDRANPRKEPKGKYGGTGYGGGRLAPGERPKRGGVTSKALASLDRISQQYGVKPNADPTAEDRRVNLDSEEYYLNKHDTARSPHKAGEPWGGIGPEEIPAKERSTEDGHEGEFKALDNLGGVLEEATLLDLTTDTKLQVQATLATLARSRGSESLLRGFSWDPAVAQEGGWVVKASADTLGFFDRARDVQVESLLTALSKAASDQGQPSLAGELVLASYELRKRRPVSGPVADMLIHALYNAIVDMEPKLVKAGLTVRHDAFQHVTKGYSVGWLGTAQRALKQALDALETNVTMNKDARDRLDAETLAALDVLYEDMSVLSDSLGLGDALDKLEYLEGDEEPELDIIRRAEADDTISDVEEADALLEAVGNREPDSEAYVRDNAEQEVHFDGNTKNVMTNAVVRKHPGHDDLRKAMQVNKMPGAFEVNQPRDEWRGNHPTGGRHDMYSGEQVDPLTERETSITPGNPMRPAPEHLTKERVYLEPEEQPPEGAQVQVGPRGGKYYENMGQQRKVTEQEASALKVNEEKAQKEYLRVWNEHLARGIPDPSNFPEVKAAYERMRRATNAREDVADAKRREVEEIDWESGKESGKSSGWRLGPNELIDRARENGLTVSRTPPLGEEISGFVLPNGVHVSSRSFNGHAEIMEDLGLAEKEYYSHDPEADDLIRWDNLQTQFSDLFGKKWLRVATDGRGGLNVNGNRSQVEEYVRKISAWARRNDFRTISYDYDDDPGLSGGAGQIRLSMEMEHPFANDPLVPFKAPVAKTHDDIQAEVRTLRRAQTGTSQDGANRYGKQRETSLWDGDHKRWGFEGDSDEHHPGSEPWDTVTSGKHPGVEVNRPMRDEDETIDELYRVDDKDAFTQARETLEQLTSGKQRPTKGALKELQRLLEAHGHEMSESTVSKHGDSSGPGQPHNVGDETQRRVTQPTPVQEAAGVDAEHRQTPERYGERDKRGAPVSPLNLRVGDHDAYNYGLGFARLFNRGLRDKRYKLSLVKEDNGERTTVADLD